MCNAEEFRPKVREKLLNPKTKRKPKTGKEITERITQGLTQGLSKHFDAYDKRITNLEKVIAKLDIKKSKKHKPMSKEIMKIYG